MIENNRLHIVGEIYMTDKENKIQEPSIAEELEAARTEKERRKQKGKKTALRILLLLIFLVGGYGIVHKFMDYRTLGCNLMVLGEDVSWKTLDETAALFQKKFQERQMIFQENGQELYRISFGDAGYSLNEESLKKKLAEIKEKKPSCRFGFQDWINYIVFIDTAESGEQLREALDIGYFGGNDSRESSKDAYIAYNEAGGVFEIVKSVLGNQIDAQKMFRNTEGIVGQNFGENLLAGDVHINIDETFYTPAQVQENQEALLAQMNKLNDTLKAYTGAQITYTFGSVTEVVGEELLRSWVKVNGLDISLDEEAIKAYIAELGAKYNTIYVPRNFHTSYGSDIVISGNEYGYWIDEEGEFAQLLSEIKAGQKVSREPMYSHRGFQRNGTDDLMGSYVELSIDSQQLWLYKDGALITQTGVVTGLPTPERQTLRGAFSIAYKESPSVLSSDVYGYETPVQYWMPFVLGQGLHDANWQSSFGGSTYLSNGSHGCVNLPVDQAALIYSYVEAGYPIIIY
jgi:hypothetical protein